MKKAPIRPSFADERQHLVSASYDERLSRLTAAEREVLKLVLSHGSSKAISAVLNIEPDSVKKRLQRAMAKLEINDRFEAAKFLAAQGGAEPSRKGDSAYGGLELSPPRPLAVDPIGGMIAPSEPEHAGPEPKLREERLTFQGPTPATAHLALRWLPRSLWVLVRKDEGHNDLPVGGRGMLILRVGMQSVALLAMIAVIMAVIAVTLHEIRDQQRNRAVALRRESHVDSDPHYSSTPRSSADRQPRTRP